MGQEASIPVNPAQEKQKYVSTRESTVRPNVEKELINSLSSLKFDSTPTSGLDNPITSSTIDTWETNLLSDPKNRLALAAISNNSITSVIKSNANFNKTNDHFFSDTVAFEGNPITNQKSSGRCWLFASTNVFRVAISKKYKLDSFELSQAYLFFYDKLEKSNYFLKNIIETVDEPLDSRLIQYLLLEPTNDGGQWDMVVNLVEKYGLVPHTLYPDSFNATASGVMDNFINNKLRDGALLLRKFASDKSVSTARINDIKERIVKEIYDILVISLGPPPKADNEFTWEYVDKDKKFHSVKTTPLDFYKNVAGLDATQYFSLIHDPRNEYERFYTVDRLGNVVGGKGIEYVNVDINEIKKAAINSIKNNEPVFFGSDVGKFSDSSSGVLDVKSWDYELGFNTKVNLTKEERLRTRASAMTHAMVLTGVHIVDGKPVKWRIENSWGETAGDKGYMTASDAWFDEYVLQVVTQPSYVPKKLVDIWKSGDPIVLPVWDPMGALA